MEGFCWCFENWSRHGGQNILVTCGNDVLGWMCFGASSVVVVFELFELESLILVRDQWGCFQTAVDILLWLCYHNLLSSLTLLYSSSIVLMFITCEFNFSPCLEVEVDMQFSLFWISISICGQKFAETVRASTKGWNDVSTKISKGYLDARYQCRNKISLGYDLSIKFVDRMGLATSSSWTDCP
jgi:hypothetical protein